VTTNRKEGFQWNSRITVSNAGKTERVRGRFHCFILYDLTVTTYMDNKMINILP